MRLFATLLFFPLVLPAQAYAQDVRVSGARFEQGLSWSAIRAKAKAAKKHIFMVLTTTSCDECTAMAERLYPQVKVGNVLNEKFVTVQVQMDTTPHDPADVKRWYADAQKIRQRYAIKVFPTLLFFSPEGRLVHRFDGGRGPDDLIALAADALNPAKQYYTLLAAYQRGERDAVATRYIARTAKSFGDTALVRRIANDYVVRLNDAELYTKVNLDFIRAVTLTSADRGFALLHRDAAKVDSVLGRPGASNGAVDHIVTNEEIRPSVVAAANGGPPPDWHRIIATIAQKHGTEVADRTVLRAKVSWYESRKDWPNYLANVFPMVEREFLTDTGIRTGAAVAVNQFAWDVFQYSNDKVALRKALTWSDRVVKVHPASYTIDTYANLLYKLGKTEEAILWEEVAFKLEPNQKEVFADVLDKMKKGEPTWPRD